MIRYCLGAMFLVACGTVGTVKDPPIYDPVEKVSPAPPKYVAPSRTKHTHHRCNQTFENKKAEILYKLDCLAEGTGGA